MNIVHRVGLLMTKQIEAELLDGGLDPSVFERLGGNLVVFDVDESLDVWPWLKERLEHWAASDVARTEFSSAEMACAKAFEVLAEPICYPEPRSGRYLDDVYGHAAFCRICGVGKSQVAEFSIRGEPKWGGRGFMQLYWVYDELFVRPSIHEALLSPRGIGAKRVRNSKGMVLADVVQVEVHGVVHVDMESAVGSKCIGCLRPKYVPSAVGMFPPLKGPGLGAWEFRQTDVWFGEGTLACRRLIVGGDLGRAMWETSPKGLALRPVRH